MTITEIKKKKDKLEKDIYELLREFHRTTEVCPVSVHVNSAKLQTTINYHVQRYLTHVSVTLESI